MLYVGVDAHQATSQVTVMDEAGNVLKRKRVARNHAGFHDVLGRYRRPMKAVLEASRSWGLVYDWLEEFADEVVLAHPGKVRAIAEARIKTDTIDSATLAHLLRADLIPAAYAPSKGVRATKRVLRQRLCFVRMRTMLKHRIRAVLSQHAIVLPEVSELYGKAGLRWLRALELPDPDGRLLQENLALLESLGERIAATDGMVQALAEGDEAIAWLTSLPGIGKFLSVLIRFEVDEERRLCASMK